MIIQVSCRCKAIRSLHDVVMGRHHGFVLVDVRGEDNEEFAESIAQGLASHLCHDEHEKQKTKCDCAILIAKRVFWKGDGPDMPRRTIKATVIGGYGDMFLWHPIGKQRKVQRY